MAGSFGKHRLSHVVPMLAAAATIFAFVLIQTASAALTYTKLHSFCSRANCVDGGTPSDRPVVGRDGILYGTGQSGGKYARGVVFKLVPSSDGSTYKEYVLHNFCKDTQCPDGYDPEAAVILDLEGNVYGTVTYGGADGQGAIFKLTHGTRGWAFSDLKDFCATGGSACTDGANPVAGLSYAGQDAGEAWDGSSPLFGTTAVGGKYNNGAAYELTVNGSSWNYAVIHNFQTSAHPNEVIVDSSGNIYGTTTTGGKYGGGLMYRLTSGSWDETILHNFCNTQNCADGKTPTGRLARDAAGNLFGATSAGGGSNCNGGCGAVFERASGGTYSVLYSFCPETNCTDGALPDAGLVIDGSGNLFGTTQAGGTADFGTVFELSGGTQSVVYSFCRQRNCADGATPVGGLIPDSAGGYFGTSYQGGSHSAGTVFRLGP